MHIILAINNVLTQNDQWINNGSICQYNLRACGWDLGPQDNWLFSGHIKYPPGSITLGGGLPTEVYFQVSYRFTQCSGECTNNYFDLYRYDTDSIASESNRINTNNYIPFFGTGTEMTTSRFQQESGSTVSKTVPYVINSPSSNGFHFGIRDSGTCGSINRFYFYYTPCKELPDGLVSYPELVRPPTGFIEPNVGQACCVANAHNTTSLEFKAHSGKNGLCERDVRCVCDAGYREQMVPSDPKRRRRECMSKCKYNYLKCMQFIRLLVFIVCPAGTYRSLNDSADECLSCPANTIMDVEGAAECKCLDRYFRANPNNPSLSCCGRLLIK